MLSPYSLIFRCLFSIECLNSVLNVKVIVGAFNQEREGPSLVGAFSVIVKTHGSIAALLCTPAHHGKWLQWIGGYSSRPRLMPVLTLSRCYRQVCPGFIKLSGL